jgi:hypothetical protein
VKGDFGFLLHLLTFLKVLCLSHFCPKGEAGDKSEGSPTSEKVARAEKRKALVDNLLDPNADSPAAKKSRTDPFSSRYNKTMFLALNRVYYSRYKKHKHYN